MPQSAKHLLIGSIEAHSGKSTASIALGSLLKTEGFQVGWGKPVASTSVAVGAEKASDTDLSFVPATLSLTPEQQSPTLVSLSDQVLIDRLEQQPSAGFKDSLDHYWENGQADVLLLEGPSSLEEGASLNLSLPEMAAALDASVLLVVRFSSGHMLDQLLSAKRRLGSSLIGVILNQVGAAEGNGQADTSPERMVAYLEKQGIPVLGCLPNLPFLRGIRVSELVTFLGADVLCCRDHLDLVVESLKIGAMNVNAALRFFGQGMHQAIVTGGDRRDLQIAALETSTHCLILTGQISPTEDVLALAQDKEVPVLSVESDTLTTVERIETLLGQMSLANPDKVPLICNELAQKISLERLVSLLGLEKPAITPHS